MKTIYDGYRMMTLLVPLNAHDTKHNRRRNVKLKAVMRWYMYSVCPGNYYRLAPQPDPRLQYGALCISHKRSCKFEPERIYKLFKLELLLHYLRKDNLCPFVLVLDDGGVGEAISLPIISVHDSIETDIPIKIDAEQLHKGLNMNPYHTPYFARQMLSSNRDKPLESIEIQDDVYRAWYME